MITSSHNTVLNRDSTNSRDLTDRKTAAHRQLGGYSAIDRSAFSLIEIMVTVALLAIIILGLVAMFNQTRRAFTSSLAQVDVLEAGRSAADMIARDLEQMAPAGYSNTVNFYVYDSPNYGTTSGLLVSQLADPADKWTNIIQELFFLTPSPPNNGVWTGIGYRLQPSDEYNSIGSLYRYYVSGLTFTNSLAASNVFGQNTIFRNANVWTNYNRIIDGVTYFRVLAYEPNGVLITNGNFNLANSPQTIQVKADPNYPGYDYQYAFYSNAVPAYVEIELGILETQALERYRSYGPGTQAANNYLTTHPGVVHIFRQRIPIRDVDPSTVFP